MTVEQFQKDFEKALYNAFNTHKLRSPLKTGNLRYNALSIVKTDTGYKIKVDLNIAEYAKWLDSKPSINQRYPEGWFDHICYNIIEELMNKYNNNEYQATFDEIEELRDRRNSNQAMKNWKTSKYILGDYNTARSVRLNVRKSLNKDYK